VPSPIPASAESAAIGSYAEFLEDPGGTLDLEAILKQVHGFTPLKKEVAYFGRTASAFWLRFRIQNDSQHSLTRFLSCEIPWLDDVRIHTIAPDGARATHLLGDQMSFASRELPHNFLLAELALAPGTTTILIRVQTVGTLSMPLFLWSEWEFIRHDRLATMFAGCVYGGILVMVLYNLFLFFSLRDPVNLFYSIHLFNYAALSLTVHGFAFMWLWPAHPQFNNGSVGICIYLAEITGLLFATTFLGTRQYPRLHRLAQILIALYVTLLIMMWFDERFLVLGATPQGLLPYSLFMLGAGAHAWTRGNRAAGIFLLGVISGIVGSVSSSLTNNGILPYTFVSFHAYELGILLDAVLLSFAIAERMRRVEEERHYAIQLAETDPLTGLFNRRGFEEHAARELTRAARYGRPLAVAILDIDHFKKVNDRYGHTGGDVVLREVAECLHQGARGSDIVGRWGGEEFILLLPETTLAEATQLGERLRLGINVRRIAFGSQEITCTASFGIAGLAPGDTLDSLIHRADTLLYQAKEQGRNRIVAEAIATTTATLALP
jgi:diguanylate cyclase (GGDEF)-like protein